MAMTVVLLALFCFSVSAQTGRVSKSGVKYGRKTQSQRMRTVKKAETATTAANGQKELIEKAIQTFLIIIAGYLLILLLTTIVNKRVKNIRAKHISRKSIIYFFTTLATLLVIALWVQYMRSVVVFMGVIGAGIALALQDAVLCIAGWFLIVARHPFRAGDRIELGGVKGDVIDIRIFQTSLLEIGNLVEADQSTGRIVNVPNSAIFKKESYNYNQGFEFVWNELKVLVTFQSDWKRAEEIMLKHGVEVASGKEDVVKQKIDYMTRRYMIKYGKLTPIVYVDVKDSGVQLTLRYLSEARNVRSAQDALWRSILDDFKKEENVDLAYPTYHIVK